MQIPSKKRNPVENASHTVIGKPWPVKSKTHHNCLAFLLADRREANRESVRGSGTGFPAWLRPRIGGCCCSPVVPNGKTSIAKWTTADDRRHRNGRPPYRRLSYRLIFSFVSAFQLHFFCWSSRNQGPARLVKKKYGEGAEVYLNDDDWTNTHTHTHSWVYDVKPVCVCVGERESGRN